MLPPSILLSLIASSSRFVIICHRFLFFVDLHLHLLIGFLDLHTPLFFEHGLSALDIGKGNVDLRMLKFVVLVEAAFGAVGFLAVLDRTFVESLNLMSIPPKPLIPLIRLILRIQPLIILHSSHICT